MTDLALSFDPQTGAMPGREPSSVRRLSDLRGCFADGAAFEAAVAAGDPVVYEVTSVDAGNGPGDLAYGVGVLYPGRVGDEFYLTRGHVHEWREAAEIYLTTRGRGLMLMQDERTGRAWAEPMTENGILVVPAFTLHRTVNVGDEPLVYIGINPAAAGHDYGVVQNPGFAQVAVADPQGSAAGLTGVRVKERTA
ncbi:MAG TPA: glucose-6-phosphate isomerase family protein [Deinococcales bacterium]|nr:glucose-6-phosphate isomerase family protein [Deinococcales bacterium]